MNYDDHKDVLSARETAQEIERDTRDKARECIRCFYSENGFWDDEATNCFSSRPKYNFHIAKPKLLKAWGEIAEQEIYINVKPASGESNKDTAETLACLMRSIQLQSNADDVYATSVKRYMISGFDACMIEQDYADNDSFDQELFIRPIPDAINRVWFFGNWSSPVAEDADAVTVDHLLSDDEYKALFPDYKPSSLNTDSRENAWYFKREGNLVSQLFYKVKVEKIIYRLPTGEVLDEEDASLLAEQAGIKLDSLESRKRLSYKVVSRFYDAGGFLNEPEDTVFDLLPVVPGMPNFDIAENKPVYFGMLQDMIDGQRTHNYIASRIIYDSAMAPKPKIWVGKKAVSSQTAQSKLKTYNDNNDPVFIHDGIDSPLDAPQSVDTVGVNPVLTSLLTFTQASIDASAGLFGVSEGKQFARQSADAINALQQKGDIGSLEYFNTLKRMATQIAKIAIHAMPFVYIGSMVKRLVGDDGSEDYGNINQEVMTPSGVQVINDLTVGVYDVYCDIGASFKSKRAETAAALESMGAIDPSIIAQNKDILLSSLDAPMMDKAAERARADLLKAGAIPESQLTEEERQQLMEAQQQPPKPDPMAELAMATAKAETDKAAAQTAKVNADAQLSIIKAEQAQQKLDFDQELQKIKLIEDNQAKILEGQLKTVEMLNGMADILVKLRQASGASAIVSPSVAEVYDDVANGMNAVDNLNNL